MSSIETERLLLRLPEILNDAADLHRVFGDPEVMKLFSVKTHATPEETAQHIARCRTREHFLGLAIVLKSTGRAVGWAQTVADAPHSVSIGLLLGREHWGNRIGSEAGPAFVGYLRSCPGIERIAALVDTTNVACLRGLEALGFEREGVLTRAMPGFNGGPARDGVMLACVR